MDGEIPGHRRRIQVVSIPAGDSADVRSHVPPAHHRGPGEFLRAASRILGTVADPSIHGHDNAQRFFVCVHPDSTDQTDSTEETVFVLAQPRPRFDQSTSSTLAATEPARRAPVTRASGTTTAAGAGAAGQTGATVRQQDVRGADTVFGDVLHASVPGQPDHGHPVQMEDIPGPTGHAPSTDRVRTLVCLDPDEPAGVVATDTPSAALFDLDEDPVPHLQALADMQLHVQTDDPGRDLTEPRLQPTTGLAPEVKTTIRDVSAPMVQCFLQAGRVSSMGQVSQRGVRAFFTWLRPKLGTSLRFLELAPTELRTASWRWRCALPGETRRPIVVTQNDLRFDASLSSIRVALTVSVSYSALWRAAWVRYNLEHGKETNQVTSV